MSTAPIASALTLRYAAQGDPAGVPVILLHGLSDSHRSYEPLLAHLPHEIRAEFGGSHRRGGSVQVHSTSFNSFPTSSYFRPGRATVKVEG